MISSVALLIPLFVLKMWLSPASFSFIFGFLNQTLLQILQQIIVKKCHVNPVYDNGIQTHDIRNTSLLP